jgi:hypothetical protein
MNFLTITRNCNDRRDRYATVDDFENIFTGGVDDLYQLSFVLTGGDHRKAERCFVGGLEDSVKANTVFKQWARSWAKRTIIQNAIRELKPRPSQSAFPDRKSVVSDAGRALGGHHGHAELGALLRLQDFDRFVFVISVLERYSTHACALLLGCSPQAVREARLRAFGQLGQLRGSLAVDSVENKAMEVNQ